MEKTMSIRTIGVIGAGAMGRGIAQIAAQAGFEVLLFDQNQDAVAAARQSLQQVWEKLSAKGKITEAVAGESLARVRTCASLQDMAVAQLVVEAIVERLDVKRELFTQLEEIVAADCILAFNTSSLSIT